MEDVAGGGRARSWVARYAVMQMVPQLGRLFHCGGTEDREFGAEEREELKLRLEILAGNF
jgi:hypothetical protein